MGGARRRGRGESRGRLRPGCGGGGGLLLCPRAAEHAGPRPEARVRRRGAPGSQGGRGTDGHCRHGPGPGSLLSRAPSTGQEAPARALGLVPAGARALPLGWRPLLRRAHLARRLAPQGTHWLVQCEQVTVQPWREPRALLRGSPALLARAPAQPSSAPGRPLLTGQVSVSAGGPTHASLGCPRNS